MIATTAVHRERGLHPAAAFLAMFVTALLACAGVAAATPSDASAAVEWKTETASAPSHMPLGGRGGIRVKVGNAGSDAATGWPTVTVALPAGVTIHDYDDGDGSGWVCLGTGDPQVVTCENPFGAAFPPPAYSYTGAPFGSFPVAFTVDVAANAPVGDHPLPITIDGGGAAGPVSQPSEVTIGGSQLPFGTLPGSFVAGAFDAAGADFTSAGGHPHVATASFRFNMKLNDPDDGALWNEMIQPVGALKDAVAELPAGFAGNPTVGPKCPNPTMVALGTCPPSTQVGVADFDQLAQQGYLMSAVYSIVPEQGTPAQFAFGSPAGPVVMTPMLRSDGDWGLSVKARDTNEGNPILGVRVSLWGVPADLSHDDQRCARPNIIAQACVGTDSLGEAEADAASGQTVDQLYAPHASSVARGPFLSNPTECSGGPETTRIHFSNWEDPAPFEADGDPLLSDPRWASDSYDAPPLVGCDQLHFSPSIALQPTTTRAASPTGLHVELSIPQSDDPDGRATAHLKDTTVVLPEGMVVNPSSADGLSACTAPEIGLTSPVGNGDPVFDRAEPSCPLSSKIGSVEVETPLLDDPLSGDVFLAKQFDNPFGSLLGLYVVVRGPGLIVKLAGEVAADPATGRLTTTFSDNPQLPFETFTLDFKPGPRAPLMTPGCGTHTAEATLVSWAAPGTAVSAQDSFQATQGPEGRGCPDGKLDPRMKAGVLSQIAGVSSPFVLRISRDDGTGVFAALDVRTPEGLLAKLKGVPYCPKLALASFPGVAVPGTGAGELASPACPAAARVGSVTVGAGAGSNPFYPLGAEGATGRIYLAGPYKGAPLSLAIVAPAVAGPFDLGTVPIRVAVHVDPRTAQITAKSDPIPTVLSGIPLDLREIRVSIDRQDFIQAPTDCSPASVDATVHGIGGGSAAVSSRFQVGACRALGFKPSLALKLFGGTKRGEYPRLRATLTARPGDANIARAAVTLPHSAFLAQEHIRTICTRVQFAADQCPAGSVYGKATAVTPLLDQPLRGPVYLRSSDNPLPDLVAVLRGPDAQPIEIELVGAIDSHNKGIRNTFSVVPDAPVSKFTLEMRGGKKGLIVNSRDICETRNLATARLGAQNGRIRDFRPVVTSPDCSKVRKR